MSPKPSNKREIEKALSIKKNPKMSNSQIIGGTNLISSYVAKFPSSMMREEKNIKRKMQTSLNKGYRTRRMTFEHNNSA